MDHPTVKLGFGPAGGDGGVCAITAAVNRRHRRTTRRRTGLARQTDILLIGRAAASEMPCRSEVLCAHNPFNHSDFIAICGVPTDAPKPTSLAFGFVCATYLYDSDLCDRTRLAVARVRSTYMSPMTRHSDMFVA